ncbi:MAG: efflux RND transporter periplasmic adaptor subunit [Nitrospirae bacterium]|nr:efflux RND transporter periplasmic adaptor subunit [Nitrospirota bacterium]
MAEETKHRNRLKWLALGGAGAAASVLVFWVLFLDVKTFFRYSAEASRFTASAIPVKAEAGRIEPLSGIIGANSLVEPASTVKLTSRVASTVKRIPVDLGQLVKQGEVLAELDPFLLEATLIAARDGLAKAKTDLENNRLNLERVTALYNQKLVAKPDLEAARLLLDSAQAAYSASVAAAEKARLDLEIGTIITAPMAAVVQERDINPGESVKESDSLFNLGRIDSVMVVAGVAQEKVGNVRLGQTAEVVFDSFPHEVATGEVVKIDPTTDATTRTFKAYIRVANPDLKYMPGLSAYARIKQQRFALTIPAVAVVTNGGQSSVFVVENSRARLRPVKIEPALFGRVAVIEGLKEGDLVVYYNLMKLKDNDPVAAELSPASTQKEK